MVKYPPQVYIAVRDYFNGITDHKHPPRKGIRYKVAYMTDKAFCAYVKQRGEVSPQVLKKAIHSIAEGKDSFNPWAEVPKRVYKSHLGRPNSNANRIGAHYAIIWKHNFGPYRMREEAVKAAEREKSNKKCICCGISWSQHSKSRHK